MTEVERLFRQLVSEITELDPGRLRAPLQIAEIYQTLVPYRRFKHQLQFDTNQDYEMAVLRLLAGEGGFATVDPPEAQEALAEEAQAINPNPGAFHDYAAARVFLNVTEVEKVNEPSHQAYAPPASPPHLRPTVADSPTVVPEPEAPPAEAPDPGSAPTLPFTPIDTPAPAARTTVSGLTTFDRPPPRNHDADSTAPDIEQPASCPSCTRMLPARADLRFCPFCGMDVVTSTCVHCGADVETDWTFCVACGRRRFEDDT